MFSRLVILLVKLDFLQHLEESDARESVHHQQHEHEGSEGSDYQDPLAGLAPEEEPAAQADAQDLLAAAGSAFDAVETLDLFDRHLSRFEHGAGLLLLVDKGCSHLIDFVQIFLAIVRLHYVQISTLQTSRFHID